MGENSKIEWCDHTWNPWMGCVKVSDGCKFCYAEALMDKRWGKVEWGPSGQRKRTSDSNWAKPYQWNKQAEKAGRRDRVFCASLADIFEDKPDQRREMDQWRYDLFKMIIATPNLDWLLLTKRPELVNSTIEQITGFSDSEMWFHAASNVWIGTSIENQTVSHQRIESLSYIPANVKFLSMEPLIETVSLDGPFDYPYDPNAVSWFNHIDWVIVGGESGHNARLMPVEALELVIEQCQEAGIPLFVKQMGEVLARQMELKDKKGGDWSEWPDDYLIREFPEAVSNG